MQTMATTQGPADSSGNTITQDSIHALVDKEICDIIKSVRPDGDPSLLILQPDVQAATARLKSVVSQLLREAETTPKQSSACPSSDLRLGDETGGDGYGAGREDGVPQDEQRVVHSADEEKAGQLGRPSLMMRKFMAAEANPEKFKADWERREALFFQNQDAVRQRKEWYFFYGSLMDPKQLQRVLGLRETPKDFRPAEIIGYHIRMWGPYPVLLDGPPGNVVKGVAYEVEGGENKDKLAAYETANYTEQLCLIQFGENKNVGFGEGTSGTTFIWAGDEGELKDGSFDLKDWQMARMLED